MSNAHITINQYEELLRRIEKVEYKHKEIPTIIEKDIGELKEEYHEIKKDAAVTDTKIGALDKKIDFKFDSLDKKIDLLRNDTDKRFDMMWKLLIVILGAILGIFGTLIGILYKLFSM